MAATIRVCLESETKKPAVVIIREDMLTLFVDANAYIMRDTPALATVIKENPSSLELVAIRKIKFVEAYRSYGPATLCELSFLANGSDIEKALFGMVPERQFKAGDCFTACITPLPGSIFYQKPLPPPKPRTPKQLESAKKRKAESKLKMQAKALASCLLVEERALDREILLAENAVEKAQQKLADAKDRVTTAKAAAEAFKLKAHG